MTLSFTANCSLENTPLTSALKKRGEVCFQSGCFDYKAGHTASIVRLSSGLSTELERGRESACLSLLRSSFNSNCVLVVLVDREVESSLLSWLSIEVGTNIGVRSVLCWSTEQIVDFLEGVTSTPAQTRPFACAPSDAAPLTILRRAFSEISQLLNSTDVIRLSNRTPSVAHFLQSTAGDMEKLPGFGAKKCRRFESFVKTPFLASSLQLSELRPAPETKQTPSHAASEVLKRVLDRMKDQEDADEDE